MSQQELYRKYRPTNLRQVLGQDQAIRSLVDMGKRNAIPHFLLLVGPSGCGKTTVARILRKKLGCGDLDFYEMNVAQFRGIDMVRDIQSRIMLLPISGKCKVWLIDEAAKLTSDAQDAFLKILEDTPSHVYFMLCTTDPHKLKKTIRTRATEIVFRSLSDEDLGRLVNGIADKEDRELSEEVVAKLVVVSEGSARKALVLLHAIIGLETVEEQLEAIAKGDAKSEAIEVARALLKPQITWKGMAKILKDVDGEPEQLRYLVLGYCRSVLLGGGGKMAGRAAMIIDRFQDAMYDSKQAGFALACYDIIHQSEEED